MRFIFLTLLSTFTSCVYINLSKVRYFYDYHINGYRNVSGNDLVTLNARAQDRIAIALGRLRCNPINSRSIGNDRSNLRELYSQAQEVLEITVGSQVV